MKIRRMATIILVVVLVLVSKAAAGQKPNARHTSQGTNTAPIQTDANSDGHFASIESHLTAIEQQADKSSDLESHLARIEKNTNDLKGSEWLKISLPAIISTLSALAGLWLGNYWTGKLQKDRLAQEVALAQQKAKGDIGSSVIEWELKQLSLLYGPMRALLGQSLGLYRQMNKVLAEMHKDEFRLVQSESSPDGLTLEIRSRSGEWERFRTVLHISRVYGHRYGIDTYFDEIVRIGGSMVEIIKQQAGYSRPEESELMMVFARYLAHYAILNHVHEEAEQQRAKHEHVASSKTNGDDSALVVDLSATFPEEIHGLINRGFAALTTSVQGWRQKAVS